MVFGQPGQPAGGRPAGRRVDIGTLHLSAGLPAEELTYSAQGWGTSCAGPGRAGGGPGQV